MVTAMMMFIHFVMATVCHYSLIKWYKAKLDFANSLHPRIRAQHLSQASKDSLTVVLAFMLLVLLSGLGILALIPV